MAEDGSKLECPSLHSIFKRLPSMREKRASLGQISGSIALHDAASKGKDRLARFILDAVDGHKMKDSRDQHGKTALIRSIKVTDEAAQLKVVRMLLHYGADVNIKDNVGRTALSYACELQCNEAIKELVKNNVDPNIDDNNGNTPLMYCALVDNAVAVTILAKSFRRLGLEVDKFNADGMTPIMVAAREGHKECARILAHEAKASVYRRDGVRNMNSIEWAKEGGWKSPEVDLLLSRRQTRTRPNKTQHMSLDKSQKTFDAEFTRDFNKALSCDSYLPDIVTGSPENSPSFLQRRKLKQHFDKLSQKIRTLRTSNSLNKLDQQRPLSASNMPMKHSQTSLSNMSEELDTQLEMITSRSLESALDDKNTIHSSTGSLSPHPPCPQSVLTKSYLSRSHETISQTMFAKEEQKSTTNDKLDVFEGFIKCSNLHHGFLERQRAVGTDTAFTHLPSLSPVPRKHITPEGR